MEMAIVFMVVIFAFCAIITTVSFSAYSRNNSLVKYSNLEYSVDQMGEYFIRALRGADTVNFTKDVVNQSKDVRGGWVKFIYNDEGSNDADALVFGVNVNESENSKRHTLRLAMWNDVPTNGNVSNNNMLLIVTAEETATGFTVVNWSNQALKYGESISGKDVPPAVTPTALQTLMAILSQIVTFITSILRAIIALF